MHKGSNLIIDSKGALLITGLLECYWLYHILYSMELIIKYRYLKHAAVLFEIWWHLKWICLEEIGHKDQTWLSRPPFSVAFISHKSWCFHECLETLSSTPAKSYLWFLTVQLWSLHLQTQRSFIRPINIVLLVHASNHYVLHGIF